MEPSSECVNLEKIAFQMTASLDLQEILPFLQVISHICPERGDPAGGYILPIEPYGSHLMQVPEIKIDPSSLQVLSGKTKSL